MGLSWEAQKALEEAEEASDRSRYVVIAMIIASILVFMAAWNSRWYGWLHLRLNKAQEAETLLSMKEGNRAADVTDGSARRPRDTDAAVRQASGYTDILQRTFTERVRMVSVPTLGFGFDANDLGLIGGIAFVFLAIWLHYSIGRERMNVLELFERARAEGTLRDAYDLLSMTQVLSTPPNLKVRTAGAHWGEWSSLLFWVPPAVLYFVLVHDILTINIGESLSPFWAKVGIITTLLLLVTLSRVTWDCWRYSQDLKGDWQAAFNETHVVPRYFITEVSWNQGGALTHLGNPSAGWWRSVDAIRADIVGQKAVYYAVDPGTGARLRVMVVGDLAELRSEVPDRWPTVPLSR